MVKKGKYASVIVLSLVLLLVTALAGCSTKESGTAATQTPSAAPSSEAPVKQGDVDNASGGLPAKYEPAIKLNTVMANYSYTKFGAGDTTDNNVWTRYIKDKYGIEIHSLWDVPFAQYEQKVNLMIASGDMPDFLGVTPSQFKQLSDAGELEDLTDIYNKYASDTIKEVIASAGAEVLESAQVKGRLMAIPWTGVAKEGVPILWIRKDWYEKFDLQPPKSMSDVLKIAELFATKDPDGNNKNDTFGFGLNKELGDNSLVGFLNGYHAYRDIWIKDAQGNLVFSDIQPEMKTALTQLQTLYKNGWIDKEFGVKDPQKVEENIGSGKIGMFFGNMGSAASPLQQLTPNNEWLPFAVPSVDDQEAKLQIPLNIYNYYWVVKKGTANPEAIFPLMQTWLDLFYNNTSDELYKQYNYNSEADVASWMNAPMKIYKTKRATNHLAEMKVLNSESKDTSGLTPEQRDNFAGIQKYLAGDKKFWNVYMQDGPEGTGKIAVDYLEKDLYMPTQFTGTPTPAMVQKRANLDKLRDQTYLKIIQGASPDEFDKFVEQWKKLGGDEITKEVNEWLKSK
ncbi:extracellular solute-binding protein [Paenibacillus eucommiae]|uniref:Aldouronate transport system substrate-binding protein n=1 Tax=Paenibacillus eucommiae TaxID=1355755 RepID=A0ABS4IWA6_9BACL|nr:extracellular solute-binding protein [Paenibacillus eucommiae]MBP1991878.1 putative aldouronate transport system substrate-binding protein [Paenibacillus eucommiae]